MDQTVDVPKYISRLEQKNIMKEAKLNPITIHRLHSPNGQLIPTAKAYLPTEEATKLLKEGYFFHESFAMSTEECRSIPAPQVLQCYKCQWLAM